MKNIEELIKYLKDSKQIHEAILENMGAKNFTLGYIACLEHLLNLLKDDKK